MRTTTQEALVVIAGLLKEDGYSYGVESGTSKYDELISLIDHNEGVAAALDDVTYTIAGILNGGLLMIAESDTYYEHFMNALSAGRSLQGTSDVIDEFFNRLMQARTAIRDRRRADQSTRSDVKVDEAFSKQANNVEGWLYKDENLQALSSAFLDLPLIRNSIGESDDHKLNSLKLRSLKTALENSQELIPSQISNVRIDEMIGSVHADINGDTFTFKNVEDGVSVMVAGYKSDLQVGIFESVGEAVSAAFSVNEEWFEENDPHNSRY